MAQWSLDILVPAYRVVFAIQGDDLVELRGQSTFGTFRSYRKLPDSVAGMIAWPNTVLLTGPENIIIDPGYQTQGDMLVGVLAARGLAPDDISTVVMTHLHSDHVTALPQLGEVTLFVHEDEMENPHAGIYRGARDHADVQLLTGAEGEIRPGLRWVAAPGHSPGHICVAVDTPDGLAVVAGDTLGANPEWFAEMDLPDDFPDRGAHLAAFTRIRSLDPAVVIPGHYPPIRLS